MAIGNGQGKLEYFEFVIAKLIEWNVDVRRITDLQMFNGQNDFSKLKILKLHFFVTAINCESNSLLTIFNDFYAMPYGHVESQLYDAINQNRLERYEFLPNCLRVKAGYVSNLLDSFTCNTQIYGEISEAITSLKTENRKLVTLSPLELVDLSHRWTSWRVAFHTARSKNKYSERIPPEMIQREAKIFSTFK